MANKGEEPKKWYKKDIDTSKKNNAVVFGLLAIIPIIALVVGISSIVNNGESLSTSTNNSSSSNKQDKKYKVGNTVSTNSANIRVEKVDRHYEHEDDTYGGPESGKEYVRVHVFIENTSGNKLSYNVYDWSLQDSSGDIKSQAFAHTENALGSGELASGGTKTGAIVFEVPANDKDLIIHYKQSLWSGEEVLIYL
ncbi:MAG: DUF4352 domain-containing protein [Candidatus Saccharibacteria bacterium]|nr:DUF4352 domain-containing protein [Candidatus Saccharibacteria bacterium]